MQRPSVIFSVGNNIARFKIPFNSREMESVFWKRYQQELESVFCNSNIPPPYNVPEYFAELRVDVDLELAYTTVTATIPICNTSVGKLKVSENNNSSPERTKICDMVRRRVFSGIPYAMDLKSSALERFMHDCLNIYFDFLELKERKRYQLHV